MASLLGSLRFRTAASFVLLAAVFATVGLYILQKVESDFRNNIEADLTAQASMVQNLVQPLVADGASPAEFQRLVRELGANTDTRITFIGPDGTVLGDSLADPATMDNHLNRPEVQEALLTGRGMAGGKSATVDNELTYVALRVGPRGDPLGFVRVSRPSAAVNSALSDITRSVLIAVLATAIAAAVLSLIVSRTVLRPLRRLTQAARAIAAGRLDERVVPRPAGEVGELADAFNQMGKDLQGLIAAASQERNRMLAALNSSTDAVLAVDAEGRVAFANTAAERMFLRPQGELVGNPFVWILPNEQVMDALRRSREGGHRETQFVDGAGKRQLHVITTPIVGGGEWTALAVFHDLSEVRRVEQVRRDFVANVSHELRTPLASIKSVIETLQAGALKDETVAEDFLARADLEVDRLAQMVEELLELSRIESGEVPLSRELVDIGAVVTRAVERLRPQAEKQQLRLTAVTAPVLPPVTGDAERLERVVINLIHNALKFTPAGGSIDVRIDVSDGKMTVQVSDTGAGIAPEDLPRVFERFYKADRSRQSGGTGLGLAVVKHTVEAHGGTVTVQSQPGKGSIFAFSIPTAPQAASQ